MENPVIGQTVFIEAKVTNLYENNNSMIVKLKDGQKLTTQYSNMSELSSKPTIILKTKSTVKRKTATKKKATTKKKK